MESPKDADLEKKSQIVGLVAGVVAGLLFLSIGLFFYFRPYEVDDKGCIVGGTLGWKNTPQGRVPDYENCTRPPGISTLLISVVIATIGGVIAGAFAGVIYYKENK